MKNIIKSCVRREQLEQQIEREEFDLVGPGGAIIGPQVWPTGLYHDSVVELLLWEQSTPITGHGQVLENGQGQQEPEVRRREDDVRGEQDDTRRQQDDARRQQDDARRQQDDARRREYIQHWEDVQRREQAVQQREQNVEGREQNLQIRERDVEQREEDVLLREQKDNAHAELMRIRQCQAYLSFFCMQDSFR